MRISSILHETISAVQKLIKHDLNIVTVDKYIINVKAGSGGAGLGRYNGVGGNGGNVYFVAKPNIAFADIKKRLKTGMKIRSEPGVSATKIALIGAHGRNEHFDVPVGVEVVDKSKNLLIARCSRPFHRYLIAEGGKGGTSQTAYKGSKRASFDIEVHLKLRPNIGFLGFPNAGKSTLLKALVPEKSVKIADYAFTTINPQIAFWNASSSSPSTSSNNPIPFSDNFTLSVADLPGIIEGASRNRGRGYQFLKHLEYADMIVMVVDCTGFQLKNEVDCPFRNPLESIALLNKEAESYDQKLVRKPIICVLNKIDLLEDDEKIKQRTDLKSQLLSRNWSSSLPEELRPKTEMRFEDVLTISAKNGDIDEFRRVLSNKKHILHALSDVDDKKLLE